MIRQGHHSASGDFKKKLQHPIQWEGYVGQQDPEEAQDGTVRSLYGTNLGKKLLSFIPEKTFRLLFKTALTIIAVKLIVGEFLGI